MRFKGSYALIVLCCFVFLTGFVTREVPDLTPFPLILTTGFPEPAIPSDNQLTDARVRLGKKLFFEKELSRDKTISCASCHNPANAFSDNKPLSVGVGSVTGERNAMPLVNLAWSRSFMWDGGIPTLEQQVLGPLTNQKEMNADLPQVIEWLSQNQEYNDLFRRAYGEKPSVATLCKAIASFERSLVSCRSKFDRYYYMHDTAALNESERRGMEIFFNDNYKMHCASCHSGANFTNESYQNNGLYSEYPDQGRFKITGFESDKGKFKVPGLRNVALTAPYMHDGSLRTLEEVVEHYSSGGKKHANKSSHVHVHPSLMLTETEKKDLVNFLKALSDEEFVNNPAYRQ